MRSGLCSLSEVVDSVDRNQDLSLFASYMIVACVVTELSVRKGKKCKKPGAKDNKPELAIRK